MFRKSCLTVAAASNQMKIPTDKNRRGRNGSLSYSVCDFRHAYQTQKITLQTYAAEEMRIIPICGLSIFLFSPTHSLPLVADAHPSALGPGIKLEVRMRTNVFLKFPEAGMASLPKRKGGCSEGSVSKFPKGYLSIHQQWKEASRAQMREKRCFS